MVWAHPVSLAATQGVDVSFLSSGYLDVSVRPLTFSQPIYSAEDDQTLLWPGCPIRRSAGRRLFSASPRLIAAVHVLHRLLAPRHPPMALNILTERTSLPLCSFQGSHRRTGRTSPARGRHGGRARGGRRPSRPARSDRRAAGARLRGLWKLNSVRPVTPATDRGRSRGRQCST